MRVLGLLVLILAYTQCSVNNGVSSKLNNSTDDSTHDYSLLTGWWKLDSTHNKEYVNQFTKGCYTYYGIKEYYYCLDTNILEQGSKSQFDRNEDTLWEYEPPIIEGATPSRIGEAVILDLNGDRLVLFVLTDSTTMYYSR